LPKKAFWAGFRPRLAGLAARLGGSFAKFYGPGQLVVSSRQPARHAGAAPRNAAVAVGFSQPVSAATAPNLRVYGSLRQGKRLGGVAGGGTASLTFTQVVKRYGRESILY
jgi:hypothetical protein